MSKNDVEIVLRGQDATGPAVDSARRNLNRLRTETDKSMGTAFIEKTVKMVVGLQGMEAAFKAVSAISKLASGDIDGFATTLERLPMGIGPVVASLRELLGEITGINDEIERLERSRTRGEQIAESRQRTMRASLEGQEAKIFDVNATFSKQLMEANEKSIKDREALAAAERRLAEFTASPDQSKEANQADLRKLQAAVEAAKLPVLEADRLDTQLRIEKEAMINRIRNEYADAEAKRAEEERVKEADHVGKLRADARNAWAEDRMMEIEAAQDMSAMFDEAAQKRYLDSFKQINDLLDQIERNRPVTPRNRVPGLDEFNDTRINEAMNADDQAFRVAMDAIMRRSVSAASLPSGAQDRFGTGLAAAGRESLQRIQNDQLSAQKEAVKKLEELIKITKDAQKAPDPNAQLNLTVSVLDGLS